MAGAAATPQSVADLSGPQADWTRVHGLRCELAVELAVPGVKVRDLMSMRSGTVINSRWQLSADVPLRVNGELIAWSEFEVVGKKLAVRITELA